MSSHQSMANLHHTALAHHPSVKAPFQDFNHEHVANFSIHPLTKTPGTVMSISSAPGLSYEAHCNQAALNQFLNPQNGPYLVDSSKDLKYCRLGEQGTVENPCIPLGTELVSCPMDTKLWFGNQPNVGQTENFIAVPRSEVQHVDPFAYNCHSGHPHDNVNDPRKDAMTHHQVNNRVELGTPIDY